MNTIYIYSEYIVNVLLTYNHTSTVYVQVVYNYRKPFKEMFIFIVVLFSMWHLMIIEKKNSQTILN